MGIEERSTLVFASGVGRIKEEKPKATRPQGDCVVRITLKRLGGGQTTYSDLHTQLLYNRQLIL